MARATASLILLLCTTAPVLAQAPEQTNAYILRHPELTRQKTLEVHYETHQRAAFWIKGSDYELKFDLAPPHVGVDLLRPAVSTGNVISSGGLNLRVTGADGRVYESARASTPARINIFRHGPHYYDVHVYDLHPTSASGDTLALRGEAILHAYPERLYAEVRLHRKSEDVAITAAEVEWVVPAGDSTRFLVGDEALSAASDVRKPASQALSAAGDVRMPGSKARGDVRKPGSEPHEDVREPASQALALGVTQPGGEGFGVVIGAPEGTSDLTLSRQGDLVHVRQAFDLSVQDEAGLPAVYARVVSGDEGLLRAASGEERHPLPTEAVQVGEGAVWQGYDARRGYYGLGTSSGQSVSYFYQHPDYMAVAPFSITNDGRARKIYVKHEDVLHANRLEAGIVTDARGWALPVLVQGSKNFPGEDEEPFYNPGDPGYSESYFPLVLDPHEEVDLRSYHARQHWGNHPLKQISSLQAWMPYYQMSVGVTETTCYVPFRYGGHGGIWVADLRGTSGEMWSSQPQFDNVGGHRYFHYRTEDGEEHFPRYVRSTFDMTSPNLTRWGMDYETEGAEARVRFDIFEAPQYDETRNFTTMRVDFDRPLRIENPAENLRLVSIDTRTQRLRYATVGYLDTTGALVEVPTSDPARLPRGVRLGRDHPIVGLYRIKPESRKHGNNALLVRGFRGTMSGRSIHDLAVTVDTLGSEDLMLSLTLPGDEVQFIPGDYLELDLMLMPYGSTNDDFTSPMKERRRFGLDAPRVTVETGCLVEHFPSRVHVASDETAAFRIEGGYSRIPILVEGFDDYRPPRLEVRRGSAWHPVEMTAGGNEGHHAYLTDGGEYGFVFLLETEGEPLDFRVAPTGGTR